MDGKLVARNTNFNLIPTTAEAHMQPYFSMNKAAGAGAGALAPPPDFFCPFALLHATIDTNSAKRQRRRNMPSPPDYAGEERGTQCRDDPTSSGASGPPRKSGRTIQSAKSGVKRQPHPSDRRIPVV